MAETGEDRRVLMRTDWRWRRGYGPTHATTMALMGGLGTLLALLAMIGFALALAYSGAL